MAGQIQVLPSEPIACPACGEHGRRVDGATIKCLLRVSLNAYRDIDYWFCRTPTCSTVYFSGDRTQTFTEADVREMVYQKHPDQPETPICYCFNFRVGDLRTGDMARQVIAAINAGIQAEQCACDWRNPQGDCCLGNVRSAAKHSR